jgi:hypothetical protein
VAACGRCVPKAGHETRLSGNGAESVLPRATGPCGAACAAVRASFSRHSGLRRATRSWPVRTTHEWKLVKSLRLRDAGLDEFPEAAAQASRPPSHPPACPHAMGTLVPPSAHPRPRTQARPARGDARARPTAVRPQALVSVEELDIAGNSLGALPHNFGAMRALEV